MTNRHTQKLAVLMSLMFLPTAIFKLTDFFLAVQFFTKWGIPLWLMHFIGVSELAGAIGLLVPRARPCSIRQPGTFQKLVGNARDSSCRRRANPRLFPA